MEQEILKVARRLQAIAQAGLWYAGNDFDMERYEEIRTLSVSLAAMISGEEASRIHGLFTGESGFQTPKVDIRAVVMRDDMVLLTRERSDGRWSLPGGFADINVSPGANAIKEVFEETGVRVLPARVLAVADTDMHGFPPLEFHYYKIIMLCDYISGDPGTSIETFESGFFSFENLPELSLKRNTPELFDLIHRQLQTTTTWFD